jgi:hypothetical protein
MRYALPENSPLQITCRLRAQRRDYATNELYPDWNGRFVVPIPEVQAL